MRGCTAIFLGARYWGGSVMPTMMPLMAVVPVLVMEKVAEVEPPSLTCLLALRATAMLEQAGGSAAAPMRDARKGRTMRLRRTIVRWSCGSWVG